MDNQQRPTNPFRADQPVPQVAPMAGPIPVPQVAPMAASAMAPPTPTPVRRPGGSLVLWLGAAFGVYMTVFSAADVRYSVVYALGGVLLGVAITLGFGWPLFCRRADRTAMEAWEKEQATTRELAALLTDEDAAIAQALAPQPRPKPKPRRWRKVGTAVAVITVLGAVLISAGDSEYKENNPDAATSSEV